MPQRWHAAARDDDEREIRRFLVPCRPSKVLAVGLNYAGHREHVESAEGVIVNAAGRPVPSDYPGVFAKGPDGFGPIGPAIVRGVDHDDLALETQAVSKGDTIEVEIEGVGVLRNTVAR
jgi:2-keto-4-pentenoate hydratase/2-oxohepta-3-ene-1,7-dioic acid hydratase in catechol pathway